MAYQNPNQYTDDEVEDLEEARLAKIIGKKGAPLTSSAKKHVPPMVTPQPVPVNHTAASPRAQAASPRTLGIVPPQTTTIPLQPSPRADSAVSPRALNASGKGQTYVVRVPVKKAPEDSKESQLKPLPVQAPTPVPAPQPVVTQSVSPAVSPRSYQPAEEISRPTGVNPNQLTDEEQEELEMQRLQRVISKRGGKS